MYLPRLRKISDAIREIRRFDGECALSAFFIHQLIRKGKISSLLYGDALLVNLDELFAFFRTSKSDGEYIPAQALPEGRSMLTSGEIFRLFRADDPGTVIRKPNLRRFVLQQDLPYTVLNGKWLIDFPSLLSALNPSSFHSRFDKPPKLRLHDDAVFDFKRLHPHLHVTLLSAPPLRLQKTFPILTYLRKNLLSATINFIRASTLSLSNAPSSNTCFNVISLTGTLSYAFGEPSARKKSPPASGSSNNGRTIIKSMAETVFSRLDPIVPSLDIVRSIYQQCNSVPPEFLSFRAAMVA